MKSSLPLLGLFLPWLGLTLAACSSDGDMMPPAPLPPLAVPAGCNPLAAEHDCLLPYPSDFFLVSDPSMPSGKRVRITNEAKLTSRKGDPIDFTMTHAVDGFSTQQPILVYFSKGVSTSGVIFHLDDPEKSLLPDSKVLLLEADTHKPVPVWAEVDMNTTEPSEQAFIIRPFVQLKSATRYIVALQGLLEPMASNGSGGGAVLTTPEGFARVRDRHTAADPLLDPLAGRYEKEIFPALTALGVDRNKLQLAWDFTTSTEQSNSRDMLDMRSDVLPKLAATPPVVTITSVVENTPMQDSEIWLRVEGTIRVPLYLQSTDVGAQLHRDASGKVTQNGNAEVPFTMQVPQSAKPTDASFVPARIMEYGHGFFGLREEINYSFMRGYSNEQHYITIAVDWWGMSEPDLDQVIPDAASRPGMAFDFVDRLQQAMVNMTALAAAIKGPLMQKTELQRFGKLLYNPAQLYYYGISQGAIFGVTMLSVNPIIDKAALSVGGGPYSLMMSRSASYEQLFGILTLQLPTPLAVMKYMALSQSTWDRVDPMTYAPHLLRAQFPGNPPNRQLLLQIGIGDHSVNNLSSHMLAQALDLPLLTPAPRPIWGLRTVGAPTANAMVVVDFHLATEPGIYCRIPTEDETNDVHEGVRRNTKIKQQLDLYFQPGGQVQDTCGGVPCSP